MTSRLLAARLEDIVEAGERAAKLVRRGRQAFEADDLLQLAGERIVEVLGEAANAINDELRNLDPEYDWTEPTAMRNLVAHEYWRTDLDQVWGTLARDVPEAAGRARRLLDDLR